MEADAGSDHALIRTRITGVGSVTTDNKERLLYRKGD